MCLYLLMVLVSGFNKRKKCIKNYPCKALRISPDLFGMKKSFKSFSFVCTNDYQELLSVQIKQKYLKRNHIICVSGIQDMLSCLNDTKNFIQRTKLTEIYSPIVGLYFDRQKCYWRSKSIIWLKRWYHEDILSDI